jgi:hypothetical protein
VHVGTYRGLPSRTTLFCLPPCPESHWASLPAAWHNSYPFSARQELYIENKISVCSAYYTFVRPLCRCIYTISTAGIRDTDMACRILEKLTVSLQELISKWLLLRSTHATKHVATFRPIYKRWSYVSPYFISSWIGQLHWSLLCSWKLKKVFEIFNSSLMFVTLEQVYSIQHRRFCAWIAGFATAMSYRSWVNCCFPKRREKVSQPRRPKSKFSVPWTLHISCGIVCCSFKDTVKY